MLDYEAGRKAKVFPTIVVHPDGSHLDHVPHNVHDEPFLILGRRSQRLLRLPVMDHNRDDSVPTVMWGNSKEESFTGDRTEIEQRLGLRLGTEP